MNARLAVTRGIWGLFAATSRPAEIVAKAADSSSNNRHAHSQSHSHPLHKPNSNTSASSNKSTGGVASREIIFQHDDAAARAVLLVGTFTDWDKAPIEMSRNDSGVWQARVRLPAGRYVYKFIVNGEWEKPAHADENGEPAKLGDNFLEVF